MNAISIDRPDVKLPPNPDKSWIPVANITFDWDQASCLFDFNTIYQGSRQFTLLVTRIDLVSGWEDDLYVSINKATLVHIGPSKCVTKAVEVHINFDIKPKPFDYAQKIPKIIFQTCSSERLAEPLMRLAIQSITLKNPEYDYRYSTDAQCSQFLSDNFPPDVHRAWSMFAAGAFKADLWRYCILWKFGGVYIDCKMISRLSLSNIILPDTEMVLVQDVSDDRIYQAFIAFMPGSELMRIAFERVVENAIQKNYGDDCLSISGPSMLGNLYRELKVSNSHPVAPEHVVHLKNMWRKTARAKGIKIQRSLCFEGQARRMKTVVIHKRQVAFLKSYPTYYYTENSMQTYYSKLWKNRGIYLD
jgi:Glycosyltransferase sugar-binding region containing DXD motif